MPCVTRSVTVKDTPLILIWKFYFGRVLSIAYSDQSEQDFEIPNRIPTIPNRIESEGVVALVGARQSVGRATLVLC